MVGIRNLIFLVPGWCWVGVGAGLVVSLVQGFNWVGGLVLFGGCRVGSEYNQSDPVDVWCKR